MIQLLRIELFKIFKRPRTYISFGIIAAIAMLLELALMANGKDFTDFVMQSLDGSFTLGGVIVNGYLVTYVILQLLLIHVPLLVALVAADELAGEANLGTLRLLLTKPISRSKIVLAKFLASVTYSFLLLIWLAIVGLALSLVLFGDGDMINLKSDTVTLLQNHDVMWRYMAAFGFASLAMTAVAAIALLLSVFAENAIGPIIGTMGIVIFLTIITNLGLPVFQAIKPFLITTHMIAWKGFFDDPVPYAAIARSAVVLLIYTVALVGLTMYIFKRKDIKS